jgi:hypothetical protein
MGTYRDAQYSGADAQFPRFRNPQNEQHETFAITQREVVGEQTCLIDAPAVSSARRGASTTISPSTTFRIAAISAATPDALQTNPAASNSKRPSRHVGIAITRDNQKSDSGTSGGHQHLETAALGEVAVDEADVRLPAAHNVDDLRSCVHDCADREALRGQYGLKDVEEDKVTPAEYELSQQNLAVEFGLPPACVRLSGKVSRTRVP